MELWLALLLAFIVTNLIVFIDLVLAPNDANFEAMRYITIALIVFPVTTVFLVLL
jgi:hypothetical protein